jgi:hypothetical protein
VSVAALLAEIDRWARRGTLATLWWRDDDACEPTPALARLVDAAIATRVPIALAVIPALLRDGLVDMLARVGSLAVLQHGFAHRNHAPAGQRRSELGADRPVETCIAELRDGAARLHAAFGSRFVPALVPPWNRIDERVVARLAAVPVRGLSTFAPRRAPFAAPGVAQVNTHVDPIDWRGSRAFVGADETALRLAAHLAARREGRADPHEPTGLLTHHAMLDEPAWRALRALLDRLAAHSAIEWISAGALFATSDRSA